MYVYWIDDCKCLWGGLAIYVNAFKGYSFINIKKVKETSTSFKRERGTIHIRNARMEMNGEMEQTVSQFLKRHNLIHTEATVLVGVSGGPDSMALLHLYKQLADPWQLRVIALSVDHQLRGEESREDLLFVHDQCARWNIPFVGTHVEVATFKKNAQLSTQVASRELRYAFYKEQMKTYDADYLALGHHSDDQVETMAMSLTHHSNTRSLSGIPIQRPFAAGKIVRPLLCVTKEHILSYCEDNHIPFRVDPSNADDTYERNYFRQHIVPLLKKQNPNIHETIQSLSEGLHEDERYLQTEAEKVVESVISFKDNTRSAHFSKKDFLAFPIALQRRAFHLVLNYLYEQKVEDITYAHEQAFLSLCKNDKSYVHIDLPKGGSITKQYEDIQIMRESYVYSNGYALPLKVPGEVALPNGDRIIASYTNEPIEQGENTFVCTSNDVHLPLCVRTRESGDRMSWDGLNGTKKVTRLFIDEKVSRQKREMWPILTDDQGTILWVIGLRKSHTKIDRSKERIYIAIQYIKR